MSNLLQAIKKAQLTARKNKDAISTALLTTVISDVEMVGKNDGNREPTDLEVIAILKKFITNVNETLGHIGNPNNESAGMCHRELQILESFLPRQYSNPELLNLIEALMAELNQALPLTNKDVGKVMKELKDKYAGLYDAKAASDIIKAKLCS